MLSPAFTWFGLLLAAPLTAILMDRGWFGWLPAFAFRTSAGAGQSWLVGTPIALPFGACLAVILRAKLVRLAPEAFRFDLWPHPACAERQSGSERLLYVAA